MLAGWREWDHFADNERSALEDDQTAGGDRFCACGSDGCVDRNGDGAGWAKIFDVRWREELEWREIKVCDASNFVLIYPARKSCNDVHSGKKQFREAKAHVLAHAEGIWHGDSGGVFCKRGVGRIFAASPCGPSAERRLGGTPFEPATGGFSGHARAFDH